MKRCTYVHELLSVVLVGMCFAAINSHAVTILTNSSPNAYSVAGDDLLQTHGGSLEFLCDLYTGGFAGLIADTLVDGLNGASTAGNYCIDEGSITFNLDTTLHPQGFDITTVNTYTGWQDQGRVDQEYTVSFRMVGSNVFTDAVYIYYEGTNNQTFVSITDLNLTGVDAVRFEFPEQQNTGVGYKEIDVIGPVPVASYTVTKEVTSTAYSISNSDLLQTDLESTDDQINQYNETGFDNQGVPALTDGYYGPVGYKVKGVGCGIASGTITYNLDLISNPAGYSITNVDTYCGWQDSGRDDQYYTLSFREVGSSSFRGAISVNYVSDAAYPDDQTHVNIADLGLKGIAALRFSFPNQENSGVGYKEIDVTGSSVNYSDVTRLDSGVKVITNDATAVVRVIEGTGSLSNITLEAATTVVQYLCQDAAAGAAVIDPDGQTLALDGISLPAGAGGLSIGPGVLLPQQLELALINNSSNPLVINSSIADGRSNATFINKTGSGKLILNGTNSYSGTTVLSDGILEVDSFCNYGEDGCLGNRAKDFTRNVGLLFRGGTLRYSGSTPQSTDRGIRIRADQNDGLGGNAVIDASGSTPDATLNFTSSASPDLLDQSGNRALTLTGSNTGNNYFGMRIYESGGTTSLIKNGPGTWIAAGANTYSGGTSVEEGVLRCNAAGSGHVFVAEGATLDVGVSSQTVAGLSGTGSVVRSWGQVSTGSDGEALISPDKNYVHLLDFGDLTAATVNDVTFEHAGGTSGTGWSLTGATSLYGELSGTQTATNGYAQLVSDFRYNGHPGVLTFSELTPGQLYNIVLYTKVGWWKNRRQDATFTNGSDSWQLIYTEPGDYGYYSFRFVANGTTASISMSPYTSDSFHWFAASLEIENPLPLTVGNGSDCTFAGVISGPTALIKQGSGKLTLSGTNTYVGDTTVSAGSLEITEGDSLPSGTSLEIAADATMILNNTDEQVVAALSVDGVPLYKGTWGGSESSAEHTSSLFSGTGVLNVLAGPNPPGLMILVK